MTLDDLARDAAARTRQEAADLGRVDLNRYRRGRQRRNGVLLGAGAIAALLTFLVVIAMSSPIEKTAVTVVTTPEIPSSTIPSPPTTSAAEPTGILGAGWEEIDAGPVAGRYRTAAVWTGSELFVWGGHDYSPYSPQAPTPDAFHRDGFLYDSVSESWREVAPSPPQGLCGGEVGALRMGDRVLLYGAFRQVGCARAAVYHPTDDAWYEVTEEFADSLGIDAPLVWTGELVVAPTIGLTYDPHSGEMLRIPVAPARLDGVIASALRAHWTGSEVIVVGSGPAYAWAPGDAEWRSLGNPPVHSRARASVWAGGLWVVNYDMAVARLEADGTWTRPGDLPLRFFECVPEAISVAEVAMIRTCSGFAVWDEQRSSWVPISLEVPGFGIQGSGLLVAADSESALYSVGPRLRRYRIERYNLPVAIGTIVTPRSMPIGVMELEVPSGAPQAPYYWELIGSFAPERSPDGISPDDETIGVTFVGPSRCTVSSTYADAWEPPAGFAENATTTIHNPGRAILHATLYRSESGGVGLAIGAGTTDVVFVQCAGGDDPLALSEHAAAFASGLWWPDQPLVQPGLVTGPGWEDLGGPVAGRQRVAAVWTGEELFVWGGHDGYSQETPGPEAFHQDAYLFDPVTDAWLPASPPPDDLCAFTEAEVIPLDEEVLLRGLAPDRDGCSQAAIYTPADDAWRVVDSPLFDVFYFRTDLVWTGEWLAAPRAGLAWVPSENETIGLPSIPDGASVLSRVDAHWTGDRIVALGGGDVYTLTPGEESWVSISGPPIQEGGRVSVWYSDGLWAAEHDHGAALLDRSLVLIDQLPRWYYSSLPLRNDECFVELLLAGDRPVAATCVGMAIWDDFWVPIPAGETGWAWQPTLVGSDDAIYSIGEGFHRFPIAVDSEGGLDDPATILIGEAFLDMGEFRISSTIGLSRVEYPDGSIGEAIAVELEGPGGSCRVTSTYQGPPLGEPESVFAPSGFLVLVFDSSNGMTDWAVRTGDGDVVRIHCESEEDAMTLVQSLWGISYPQT